MAHDEEKSMLPSSSSASLSHSPVAASAPDALPRTVGYVSGTLMCVGMIIGSGIFSIPGLLLGVVGSPGMVVLMFIIGAIVAFFGTWAYVELGCMRPISGGDKEYLAFAYPKLNHLFSFAFCASLVCLARPGQAAAVSIAFGQYVMYSMFGPISHVMAHGPESIERNYETLVRTLAVLSMLFTTIVHYFSPRLGIQIQDILSTSKLLLLGLVVLIGLAAALGWTTAPPTGNFTAPFANTLMSGNAIASGLFSIFFAYAGWNNLNYCVDELIEPQKNLPRAAFTALGIVASLYVLATLSYFVVVPLAEIDPQVSTLAAQFFTKTMGATMGGNVVPFLIALSALGSAMCNTFGASRVAFAAAREGFFPLSHWIGQKNRFDAPGGALLLHFFLTSLFIILPPAGPAYAFLINASTYPEWIFFGLTVTGLLLLRHTQPTTPRPIRSSLLTNLVFIACCIFLTIFPFIPPPQSKSSGSSSSSSSGIPYYLYALVGLLWVGLCVPWWYVQVVVFKGMETSMNARESCVQVGGGNSGGGGGGGGVMEEEEEMREIVHRKRTSGGGGGVKDGEEWDDVRVV